MGARLELPRVLTPLRPRTQPSGLELGRGIFVQQTVLAARGARVCKTRALLPRPLQQRQQQQHCTECKPKLASLVALHPRAAAVVRARLHL